MLPEYITNCNSIIGLSEVENNMCFWACMALAEGCRRDRYVKRANELFTNFYNKRKTRTPESYVGFDYINELDRYEKFNKTFGINIVSYYEDETISYIRKSPFNTERSPIYLNLYLNHFSYISDFQKLGKSVYICQRCDMQVRDNSDMQRHINTCTLDQVDVFSGFPKLWKKDRNIIVEFADYYGVNVDFKYDYMISI